MKRMCVVALCVVGLLSAAPRAEAQAMGVFKGGLTGAAAAALLEMPSFRGVDLLVTDLMMPQMDRRPLSSLVRRRYPSVRVLFVTGFADTLCQGVQELGEGESCIEKPFGAEGLLEAAPDKRDSAEEFVDDRLRTKVVQLLKRLRLA